MCSGDGELLSGFHLYRQLHSRTELRSTPLPRSQKPAFLTSLARETVDDGLRQHLATEGDFEFQNTCLSAGLGPEFDEGRKEMQRLR